MVQEKLYGFHQIVNCNMCGASEKSFRPLGKRLNRSQGLFPSKKMGISVSVVKRQNCGLIFSNPQPIPNKIGDHYDIDPDQYWKENYFLNDPGYFSGEIEWLKKLQNANGSRKMRSLDIGAGLGKQMIALQNVGYDAFGIEPSVSFHNMAIEKMGLDQKKLILSSIEDTNFENDQFDFISFGVVLEHLKDPSHSLSKALKWLRKDGLIHIEVPSSRWLTARIFNFLYKIRGLDYVTNLSPMHPPFHLYEFSLNSFKKNGDLNGYVVVDYAYYVCPSYLPSILDWITRPLMKHTNTGMQLCVWLRKV